MKRYITTLRTCAHVYSLTSHSTLNYCFLVDQTLLRVLIPSTQLHTSSIEIDLNFAPHTSHLIRYLTGVWELRLPPSRPWLHRLSWSTRFETMTHVTFVNVGFTKNCVCDKCLCLNTIHSTSTEISDYRKLTTDADSKSFLGPVNGTPKLVSPP